MADKPFDRTIINVRERPLSTDINQLQSQADRAVRDYFDYLFLHRTSATNPAGAASAGFVNDGFKVVPSSPLGLSVVVTSGMGFFDGTGDQPAAISSITGLDDLSRYKPLNLTTSQTIAVPVNGLGAQRWDIIEVKYDRRVENPLSRDILNPTTGAFNSTSVNKTLAFNQDSRTSINGSASINYKTGTAGTEPAVTAGYTKIARVLVDSPTPATIDADRILDFRKALSPGGVLCGGAQFTINAGTPASSTVDFIALPPGWSYAMALPTIGPTYVSFNTYLWGGSVPSQYAYNTQAGASAGGANQYPINVNLRGITAFSGFTATETGEITAGFPAGQKVALGQHGIRMRTTMYWDSHDLTTAGVNIATVDPTAQANMVGHQQFTWANY